jgi:high-affinity nickel permease
VTPGPLAVLGLGFVLGLRHALDVDHLAAVSTLVNQRRGLWGSSLIGALWGLGHTAALLAAGVAVIALHAKIIPPGLELMLELGVAAMLVGLGLNVLWKLWRGGTTHVHAHEHGGRPHLHLHLHDTGSRPVDGHHHAVRAGRRPFLVGVVHGFAGSAALMLAVLATIPSPALAVAYILVFGFGSVVGMALMSTVIGLPLALAARRFARAEQTVRVISGVTSVTIGLFVAWKVGTASGFFG